MTLNPAAPSISERLVLIIQGICQANARHGAKDWASSALLLHLWGRLQRMARRFQALAALARAGRLPGEPNIPPTRPARPPTPNRPQPLPRGFAWLLRLVPEVAAYGSQLQYLLTDPEIAALLKQAPQAGRILRPLCRMLGVQPGPATLPPARRTTPQAPQADPPDTSAIAESPPGAPLPPDRSTSPTVPCRVGFSPPTPERA